ncbi:MAG: prepilin-type N-terminal cleavage/methylation domain-containing protein [Bacilli bacterium]|nr:prepilin-type N-terminal cleavage/methylation domain-containing protein [Bacilli bacterium]
MKKGFTLIELLAVIVILAIIAVITMPMITRVIDKAKIGALEDSAYGLIEAANLYYTQHISEINTTTFVTDETKKGMYAEENKLPYKGFIPDSGSQITINEQGKISIRIISGDYCAIKSINETKITLLQKDCTTSIDGETTVDTNVTSEDIEILQNQIDTMNAQVITNTEDITNITNDLNGIKFGTDAEGNYGYYKEGETTLTKFDKGREGYTTSFVVGTAVNPYPAYFKIDCRGYNSVVISGYARPMYSDYFPGQWPVTITGIKSDGSSTILYRQYNNNTSNQEYALNLTVDATVYDFIIMDAVAGGSYMRGTMTFN